MSKAKELLENLNEYDSLFHNEESVLSPDELEDLAKKATKKFDVDFDTNAGRDMATSIFFELQSLAFRLGRSLIKDKSIKMSWRVEDGNVYFKPVKK